MSMQIISDDRKFARMLQIVLEDAGYTPVDISSRACRSCDYSVVDFDFCKDVKLGGHCVSFSKSAAASADLQRPFAVSAFLRLVSERFGSSDIRTYIRPLQTIDEAEDDRPEKSDLPRAENSEISILSGNRILIGGKSVKFSAKEFKILILLLDSRGKTVEKSEIRSAVFGPAAGNCVEVYINYLRKKLEPFGDVCRIRTVRGKGYTIL